MVRATFDRRWNRVAGRGSRRISCGGRGRCKVSTGRDDCTVDGLLPKNPGCLPGSRIRQESRRKVNGLDNSLEACRNTMLRRVQKWLWDAQGLTCQEATRLAARAIDHPLTFVERLRLLLHNLLCVYCRTYARQLRWMRKWARRLDGSNVPPSGASMPTAMASRLKEKLDGEILRRK